MISFNNCILTSSLLMSLKYCYLYIFEENYKLKFYLILKCIFDILIQVSNITFIFLIFYNIFFIFILIIIMRFKRLKTNGNYKINIEGYFNHFNIIS